MARKVTRLVLGFGEVYFNPFLPGTLAGEGEIYIGNTPDFSVSKDVTTQDVKDSVRGQLIQLEAEVISETHTIHFSTDDVELDNVGLWFGGLSVLDILAPSTAVSEIIQVRLGRYYQLGVTPTRPQGVRGVSNISAAVLGLPVDFDSNFELDSESGRVHAFDVPGAIHNLDIVTFTYDTAFTASGRVTSISRELWGSLRFVATNDVGPKKSWFYPAIRLKATGETALKAEVWQQWAFEGEARKVNPLAEYVYVEENITDLSGDLGIPGFDYATFPQYEDLLNTLINVTMPSRGY